MAVGFPNVSRIESTDKTRAGLRHAVVCPNVTGKIKERIAQSKQARRAGSFAIVIVD